jgi:hypothetical protein
MVTMTQDAAQRRENATAGTTARETRCLICEALVYDRDMTGKAGRLVRRRCRKQADGRVGGLNLCTHHVGMLYVYGDIDAECDEPGHVRRLTIESSVTRIAEKDGEDE